MKLLHLSSKVNRESILKNGLLPSKISLENHTLAFQSKGLIGDKCVYTWNADSRQTTDKYIRDMIYCKLFIHPRNKWGLEANEKYKLIHGFEIKEEKEGLDYRQFGTELFGKTDTYDLFEIEVDEDNPRFFLDAWWQHAQEPEENPYASCHMLNEKYAHDDKLIHISGYTIPPDMLKLVTSVKSRLYKNDTIGISYSKNI